MRFTNFSKQRQLLLGFTPSRLIKRQQIAILDYLQNRNHKYSVSKAYQQDKSRKARRAGAELSILDKDYMPYSLKGADQPNGPEVVMAPRIINHFNPGRQGKPRHIPQAL